MVGRQDKLFASPECYRDFKVTSKSRNHEIHPRIARFAHITCVKQHLWQTCCKYLVPRRAREGLHRCNEQQNCRSFALPRCCGCSVLRCSKISGRCSKLEAIVFWLFGYEIPLAPFAGFADSLYLPPRTTWHDSGSP